MRRPKGIKGKIDALMSRLIREAADWTCERCGSQFPEGKRMGLHWSHWIGRSAMSVRWHPDNGWSHCYGCHSYLGSRPHEFNEWVREQIGEELMDILREKSNVISRYRKYDHEQILAHYQGELDRVLTARSEGVRGKIEVEAYE